MAEQAVVLFFCKRLGNGNGVTHEWILVFSEMSRLDDEDIRSGDAPVSRGRTGVICSFLWQESPTAARLSQAAWPTSRVP